MCYVAYEPAGKWYIIESVSIPSALKQAMNKASLTLFLWSLFACNLHAEVVIVTSIEPLALIGKAIVGEHGEVSSLVDARQSGHEYSMRPSDRIEIDRAHLLIRIDPGFEHYLSDVFEEQAKQTQLITLSSLPNAKLAWEATGELDPHLWLDTDNAAVLAEQIDLVASTLGYENRNYYAENLQKFRSELAELNAKIAEELVQAEGYNYAVYHNAYRYFEEQFGLRHSVVLLQVPDSQPNVQEILQVRESIQELKPGCVLIEPDSNLAVIETMLDGLEVEMPIVDALGYRVNSASDGYLILMKNLADQFSQCIK